MDDLKINILKNAWLRNMQKGIFPDWLFSNKKGKQKILMQYVHIWVNVFKKKEVFSVLSVNHYVLPQNKLPRIII